MKRFGWIAIIVLVLLIPFTLTVMQDDSSITLDIIGLDASALPEVVVNTSVLDDKGQLISGLGVENFSVGGDLAEIATVVEVENVTDDNLAFASVLVIDTSTSMVGFPLEQAQEAARNYIGALGVNDPVAIMSFNTTVQLVQDYTTDKSLLLSAIDNLAFGGQTALYDATLSGIDVATRAPLPRKAVVILSDGGEYGGVSRSVREDSIQASTVEGVPVYTVGLGWQIDRRFLEVISSESNAQFYPSPTPDELIDIYNNLAFLFRTQYIVTLDIPVPADGTRYAFSLDVTTPDGQTASNAGILRVPIPVPILSFPEGLFAEPITGTTTVTVDVAADDDIASTEYRIGEDVVSTTESYTIEPATTAPGTYTLDVEVVDVDGDTGAVSADFTVAALPPTVSSDFAPVAGTELSEPQTITVTAGGQTDITDVEFLVDNTIVATDSEAPYEFTLDPFTLSPGGHILTIQVNNAGGQSTSTDTAFVVASIPPQIAISGLTAETVLSDTLTANILAVGQSTISEISVEAGEDVIASAMDVDTLDFTLDAIDFAPGTASVEITVTDSNGATSTETLSFAVAALPPTVEITGLAADDVITGDTTVTVNGGGQTDITIIDVGYDDGDASTIVGSTFTIPAETLGDGDHEVTIVVTNAGGQSTSVSVPFVVNLPPTPTFTPTATVTDEPTEAPSATDTDEPTEAPSETDTDEPTVTPSATPDSTETAAAAAEIEEQETADAVATLDAENTQAAEEATATVNVELTTDAQETLDAELTVAAENVRATADARGTQQAADSTSTASAAEEATTEANESASIQLTDEAEEEANATATAEAQAEADSETATAEAEEDADNATASAEAEEADALATTEAEETANAQLTADAEDSEDATEIAANIEASSEASEEPTEVPTEEEPTDEPTEVLATSTELPTEEGVEDPTAQPSLTPVEIEEVDASSADQQETSDNSTAIIAAGAGLLLLLLLFFGLRRRGE